MGVYEQDIANATKPEANIDMFVTQDPSITNLNPVAISNCLAGVGTSQAALANAGTQYVFYTNSVPGQTIYYVGIQSEDQMGAEYDFLPVFTDVPFSSLDQNGNQIVNGLLLPTATPTGNNAHPGVTNIFALAIMPMVVEKVTVTNLDQHQNFGDLYGSLSFGGQSVVLNNHDGYGNTFNRLPIAYDDSPDRLLGTTNTDGPGSLLNFRGQSALGPWILTILDDSAGGFTGQVARLTLLIQPHRDLKEPGVIVDVPPGGWFVDYVDVPAGYTNLTFFATNGPPIVNPAIEMFEKYGDDPTLTYYDQEVLLTNTLPGGDGSVSAADVNFASNGILSMAAQTQIIGAITATGAGHTGTGTVSIVSATGGSSTNIVGSIGTSTDYLGTINASGTGISVISGAVNAAALNMGPGGTLELSGASNNITTTAFGNNNAILALNSGAGLNGNITATGAGTTGAGTLFLSGTSNIANGTIGTSTDYLGTIQLGTTPGSSSMTASEITGAVNAAALIMGIGEAGATGSLQLDSATNNITKTAFTINPSDETLLPTLILNTGAGLNGNITATGATSAGAGTLTLAGGNTVNGQIATSTDYLGTINANGAGASTISGAVNAALLNMGPGGGSLQLNNAAGNTTTTDNIAVTLATNNDTLILATGVNLSGIIIAPGVGTAGAAH